MTYTQFLKPCALAPAESIALAEAMEVVADDSETSKTDKIGIADLVQDIRDACGNPDECGE